MQPVDRFQYLLLMAGCLVITLPLEFWFGARVWRRPRRLLAAMVPVLVVFCIWDAWAIRRGTWSFSARYTTGWRLPLVDIPVEEIAFFLAIPICGLLTLEAVRNIIEPERRNRLRLPFVKVADRG